MPYWQVADIWTGIKRILRKVADRLRRRSDDD